MGLFFGTDGLRGKVNEGLTFDVAYKIGNALSILKENPKIIIGSDTRISNTYLILAVASGAISGGAKVIDIGICFTAGIAYITKKVNVDYGVVVSASHNSWEYNGIKVFNKDGFKLGDKEEEKIERCFIREKINNYSGIGSYSQDYNLVKLYKDFLIEACKNRLIGKMIVLDGANGAAYKIAPEVFKKLGAKVICVNCKNNGEKINDNCGAVFPENLAKKVVKFGADVGFAFDGDSDRIIAVDNNGKIIDGDMIICILAKYFKKLGKLNENIVVGTSHTNMAIEEELLRNEIKLIRTDIGDKYVLAKMLEKNLSLGGEQSGHVILKDYATTGDGILTGIVIADMIASEDVSMSDAFGLKLYPQTNKNVIVEDKFRVMNNENLSNEVSKYNLQLSGEGRVMIRASGTEPKIRVMVESKDEVKNETISNNLVELIKKINTEFI